VTATTAKSSERGDRSRADRSGDYRYKKAFYQDEAVAAGYDEHRFVSPARARRNRREWRTIARALTLASGTRTVLDLPCGTGRFTGEVAEAGYEVVGSDIAAPMMRVALDKVRDVAGVRGFVRADAEKLPFSDASVDCVMSIRFLLHVDRGVRVAVLREMARVARRWLVLDYRHKYSYRYALLRVRQALGFRRREIAPQLSRAELTAEVTAAGLRVVGVFPVARVFSDKWVVLCEKALSA
jgi:ubiquinone/menaquinone biosynthesis C-methylase UbiE